MLVWDPSDLVTTTSMLELEVWSVERSVRIERAFRGVVEDITNEAIVAAPVQTPQEATGVVGLKTPS